MLNDTWDVTQKFVKKYKDTSFLSRLTILLVYHHLSYLLVGVHPYINYWVLILWFSHLRFMFDEQTELVISVFVDLGNILQLIPFLLFVVSAKPTWCNLGLLLYTIVFMKCIRKPFLSFTKLKNKTLRL